VYPNENKKKLKNNNNQTMTKSRNTFKTYENSYHLTTLTFTNNNKELT